MFYKSINSYCPLSPFGFIFAIIGILLTKIAFNKKTSTDSASNVAINNIPDSPTYQVGQSVATCSVNTQNEPTNIEPSPSIHSESIC